MKSKKSAFVNDLLERLAPLGELRARSMFGGTGLYCDDLFFGLVDEGVLYFKVNDASVGAYRDAGTSPFQPFPDKPPMGGYWEVPASVLDRDALLREWASQAIEVARGAKHKR